MAVAKIDYVLFDAGGTLVGTNTDSEFWFEQFFVDCCAEQGCKVSVHDVHEVLRRAAHSRRYDNRCSSDAQARDFWQHIYSAAFSDLLGAKSLNRTPAFIDHLAADYIDRFEQGEFIRLFPDALPCLQALKEQNVRMGIVSNFSTYLQDFLKKLEISDYFDFVVISAEEGCEKPGTDLFYKAIHKCNGSQPANMLFVGDHPEEDYLPAKECGMNALLIDRHNRHATQENMSRISRLTEVPDFLQA